MMSEDHASSSEAARANRLAEDLSRALEIADLALERAERAESAKGRFLAQLSHEVRNPLNSVLGLIGLVLKTELEPGQRRYLEMAEKSGKHLVTILNLTLNLSKLEQGSLELEYRDFPLSPLLEEIFAPYLLQLKQRGVTGRLQLAPGLPPLWYGDPDRLRQIIVNLLDNAVKFTATGHVVLLVELEERVGRPSLHCRVIDTGIGIAPAKVERLFIPFSQADQSVERHYGGTGLGLSICRQLVELMGGKIEVVSREGRGTVFHFNLPLPRRQFAGDGPLPAAEDAAPAVGSAASPPADRQPTDRRQPADSQPSAPPSALPPPVDQQPADRPPDLGALTILVTDDDYVNRLVTMEMLKGWGVKVAEAVDGREALERLAAGDIDLLLLDMQMPVMDGPSAAAAIRRRESEKGGHLPIIAMTGLDSDEDQAACRAAGVDDILLKPFSQEALQEAILSLIRL